MLRFGMLLMMVGCFPSWICAQHHMEVRWDEIKSNNGHWQSDVRTLATPGSPGAHLSYYAIWEGRAEPGLSIRFSRDGRSWSEWEPLEPYDHNPAKRISDLYFTDAGQRWYELRAASSLDGLSLRFFWPGTSRPIERTSPSHPADRSCPCPLPPLIERASWCPDNDCPPNPDPAFTQVTHLVVHHSATSNEATDWAAVVRSFWDFHVNGNGWSDIGYNYLVDPDGMVYEGRGDNVLGAHFCGQNTQTMGVCVMGDFTDQEPSLQARQSLSELLAWKSCDADLQPLDSAFHPPSGLVLPRICGHRDGCNTSCPGDRFYPLLPGIRHFVSDVGIEACGDLLSPLLLQGEEFAPGVARLEWAESKDDPSGHELQRSVGGDTNFESLVSLPADADSYEDPALLTGNSYFYRIRTFDGPDTSAWSNVVRVDAELISSVKNPGAGSRVQLFPNPARGRVTVRWSGLLPDGIRLVNGQGQTLWQLQEPILGEEVRLSVASLPAGYYIIQLLDGPRILAAHPLVRH